MYGRRKHDIQIHKKRVAVFYLRTAIPVAALAILSAIAIQGTVLEATESSLATHMLFEHALFFLIGALSVLSAETFLKWLTMGGNNLAAGSSKEAQVSPLRQRLALFWSRVLRSIFANMRAVLWLAIAVVLMAFWHMPAVFDLASTHPNVHVLQHISFVIVGAAGLVAIRAFGTSFQIILLILIIGMMGFAGLLFSVSDQRLYVAYSVQDHNVAGTYMIASSMVLLIIGLPAFLIKKTLTYVRATYGAKE